MSEEQEHLETPPKRFNINRAGEELPFCLVSWSTTKTGHEFLISVKDEKELPARDELANVMKPALGNPLGHTPTREEAAAMWMRVKHSILAAGYTLTTIPEEHDFHMEMVIDLEDGQPIGRTSALHGMASVDPGLSERLAKAFDSSLDSGMGSMVALIQNAISKGDPTEAAQALISGMQSEIIILRRHGKTLRSVTNQIETEGLEANLLKELLKYRISFAAAANEFDQNLKTDTELLLSKCSDVLTADEQLSFRTGLGVVALREGHRETAHSIWTSIVNATETSDVTRAWAYRNLSFMLEVTDPRSGECARAATDTFLVAGDRKHAARCLLRYAQCVLADSPQKALDALHEVLSWSTSNDLLDIEVRAAVFYSCAEACLKLGDAKSALVAAKEASDLLRGLYGREAAYANVTVLAARAAKLTSAPDSDAIHQEMEIAVSKLSGSEHLIRKELQSLFSAYDANRTEKIREEANHSGRWRDEFDALLLMSLKEKEPSSRIQKAEYALEVLRKHTTNDQDFALAHRAIAQALLSSGQEKRALSQYRETLKHDPLNSEARQNFVALLEKFGLWHESISFLERELMRHGDQPGLLLAYGRALLGSKDATKAVCAAKRARMLLSDTNPNRIHADKLLDDALAAGGIVVAEPEKPQLAPVTREEFEACLRQFSSVIASEKRMSFWQVDNDNNHKWTTHPERKAQDLFHIFLSGKFGERVDVFEEIDTGAGRLDLLVTARQGIRCIIELKILGAPGYSTSYAFQGTGQIAHYMEQRQIHLGYLVIFDARRRDYSTGLNPTEVVGNSTVRVFFVDVRPTVTPR
jgi:tetratricopeptide (TPR) repeat protein